MRNLLIYSGILFVFLSLFVFKSSNVSGIQSSYLFYLQMAFIFEALIFFYLAFQYPKSTNMISNAHREGSLERFSTRSFLCVVLLGSILRLWEGNTSLWIDEAMSRLHYSKLDFVQMLYSFETNNHILNNISTNALVALFGESEWVIRLSASLFGVGTLILLYPTAYLFSRSHIFCCASVFLMSVSYFHIFFSQNSRGYSSCLFFSVWATFIFIKMLKENKTTFAILYIITIWLNTLAFLFSIFVFVSHFIVVVYLYFRKKLHHSTAKVFIFTFAITSLLLAQTYILAAPAMYEQYKMHTSAYIKKAPSEEASTLLIIRENKVYFPEDIIDDQKMQYEPVPYWKYFLFRYMSLRHFLYVYGIVNLEISKGFGFGICSFVILAIIGIYGFFDLLRKKTTMVICFVLPVILTATALVIINVYFAPRFFIFFIVIGILSLVNGVICLSNLWRNRQAKNIAVVSLVVIGIIFVIPLPTYYKIPKQSYRQSLEFIENLKTQDTIVIVNRHGSYGYKYYLKKNNIDSKNYVYSPHLDTDVSKYPLVQKFLVMVPLSSDVKVEVRGQWKFLKHFPAKIQNGDIYIWISEESK